MLGTRKPVEDLRAATKMELTSGGVGGPVTVTKPSYAIPSSVTAPLLAHTWKSSGFSQCSASCLGGISIDFSFPCTVGHCSFNGTLFLTLYYRLSSLYNQYGNSATAAAPAVEPGNLFDLSLVLVSLSPLTLFPILGARVTQLGSSLLCIRWLKGNSYQVDPGPLLVGKRDLFCDISQQSPRWTFFFSFHFDPERRAAKPIQFSSSFQMFLFICRRTLLATSLKFVHFISKKIRLCY